MYNKIKLKKRGEQVDFLKAMLEPISIVIILGFGFNIWVFYMVRKNTLRLENIVRPKSDRRSGVMAELTLKDEELAELMNCAEMASGWYSLFTNITAVFPLLGILGTVWSLMQLSGTENLAGSFMSALTTTFLGLICAILFKIADSFITARLDRALDESDYLIHEHDKEKRNVHEAQT